MILSSLGKLKRMMVNRAVDEEPVPIMPDAERLLSFHDLYKGQRCFIIGNGPSLNEINLDLLDQEYTFGVNGIFYKTEETGFRPSFYVVEDKHVISDNLATIEKYKAKIHRFFPTDYKHLVTVTDDTSFFRMNQGFYIPEGSNYRKPRFSKEIHQRIYCGQSVTIINLQLAFYMGFKEVYLVGMDFRYLIPATAKVSGRTILSNDIDPNHFHPDYFGKGKKWHDPQLAYVRRSYEYAKEIFEQDGREIVNATIGGELDVFRRVDFSEIFKGIQSP